MRPIKVGFIVDNFKVDSKYLDLIKWIDKEDNLVLKTLISQEIELGKTFYSSGLGGVFSRDIKIGNVFNIIESEPTRRDLEIKIIASPLESSLFGVIKY